MQDDGQVEGQRPIELLFEGLTLLGAIGGVPIEVESDFADGAVIATRKFVAYLLQCGAKIGADTFGVQAHGHGTKIGESIVGLMQTFDAAKVFVGQHNVFDAGGLGGGHHGSAVGIEFRAVYVRMCIDHSVMFCRNSSAARSVSTLPTSNS